MSTNTQQVVGTAGGSSNHVLGERARECAALHYNLTTVPAGTPSEPISHVYANLMHDVVSCCLVNVLYVLGNADGSW